MIATISLISSFVFTSCGDSDDEPDNPSSPNQPDSPNHGEDDDNGTIDIAALVRNNVNCTCSYSDYHVNITLKHNLVTELPGASITYQIGHAERGSSICQIISGGRYTITPSISTSGTATTATFRFPFYYYFLAKLADPDTSYEEYYYKNASAECELYLASYMALANQGSLSSDERDLYNSIVKELNKYQSEVRGSYTVWIYIIVDGHSYLVKSYNV